jgi:hypothetical protein
MHAQVVSSELRNGSCSKGPTLNKFYPMVGLPLFQGTCRVT